jgi:hypothetical protein
MAKYRTYTSIDSLAPARAPLRAIVHVARLPSAPFPPGMPVLDEIDATRPVYRKRLVKPIFSKSVVEAEDLSTSIIQ